MRVRSSVMALVAVVAVAQGALLVLDGNETDDASDVRSCSPEELAEGPAEEMAEDHPGADVSVTYVCEGDPD